MWGWQWRRSDGMLSLCLNEEEGEEEEGVFGGPTVSKIKSVYDLVLARFCTETTWLEREIMVCVKIN